VNVLRSMQARRMPFVRSSRLVFALSLSLCACSAARDEPQPSPEPEQRMTIRIEGAGGQTGMEGTCGSPVQQLALTADDLNRLIATPRESTLAYRSETQPTNTEAERGRAMKLSFAARGPVQEVPHCGGSLHLPVELTLSFEQPALDVVISETVHAFAPDVVVLQVQLPATLAAQLGLIEASRESRPATLTLFLDEEGTRGTIESASNCGKLVFPEQRPCAEHGSVPVPLDVQASEALARIDAELRDVPVRSLLDDKRTSVTVSQVGELREVCSGYYAAPRSPANPMRIALDARVVSDDGRLDLILPGELSFAEAGEQESGVWSLRLSAVLPNSSLNEASPADEGWSSLKLNIHRAGMPSAEIWLRTLTLGAGITPLSAPRFTLWPACFGSEGGPSAGVSRN
jgi:hypothetical protein